MIVSVDKIRNPRSENDGMWVVYVAEKFYEPMKSVFMDKSKKVCVEYAKRLSEKPVVGNGIEYGAKW